MVSFENCSKVTKKKWFDATNLTQKGRFCEFCNIFVNSATQMHRLYAIFCIFASDMAKTYQSFSRRLSRRLILIVLIMMGLMVVGMVTGTLFVTEEVSEAHYQVVMETSKKSIEKELRSVERCCRGRAPPEFARGCLRDTRAQPSSEHGCPRLFRCLRARFLRWRGTLVLCPCLLGW